MIALQLLETKDFMNKLLCSEIFDHFCLIDAVISTFQTVAIDGKTNQEYYSCDEPEYSCSYNTWEKVKPFCFDLIKGKRTPLSFRITLSLSEKNIENVLHSTDVGMIPEQVKGLLMNFKFDGEKILCTTGTSLHIFTLDKRLEMEWDSLVEKFLKKYQIAYCLV